MPFLRRREKPLHERLAEGTGLLEWRSKHAPVYPASFAGTLDVLHGGKPRRWDAVGTAEAPGLPGDALEFTALPDATVLVEDERPGRRALAARRGRRDGGLAARTVPGPSAARATVWAVAANAIEVVELTAEIAGDTVSLAVQDGERDAARGRATGVGEHPDARAARCRRSTQTSF